MDYSLKMTGGNTLKYQPVTGGSVIVTANTSSFTVPKQTIRMTSSSPVVFDGETNKIRLRKRVSRNIIEPSTLTLDIAETSSTFTITGLASKTFPTSDFFNSENPTQTSVEIPLIQIPSGVGNTGVAVLKVRDVSTGTLRTIHNSEGMPAANITLVNLSVTLTAKPRVDSFSASYTNTAKHYSGYTTATITAKNPHAQYGGNLTSIECAIGDQVISDWSITGTTYTGTIEINQSGTFTPKLTLVDSRGLKATEPLSSVTILPYTLPTTSFSVSRIANDSLTVEDDGTRVLVKATFDYADGLGNLPQPIVKIMKVGESVKYDANITWYTDSACTTTVDWSNYNPNSGVTLYGIITGYDNFTSIDSNYSYGVYITARDAQNSGSELSQTVSAAFYTIDFLAGGRAIAFGAPCTEEGFYSAMPMSTNDMPSSEIDDFVDSLDIEGLADVDYIIDKKTVTGNNGWLEYRKYNSGRYIIDSRISNLSLTNYSSLNTGFYAYYYDFDWGHNGFPSFASVEYEIVFQPEIGTGWAMPGTVLSRTDSKCRLYALGTSSGTQTCAFNIHMAGRWK